MILAVAINAIITSVSQGQTNSWISSTDGFWDEARLWSLAEPPSIAQSAILITNAASETVMIDSITASSFTSALTISNLSVSAPSGSINTLFLDNTGTIALHILNGLTIGIDFDDPFDAGGSELIVSNSTLMVDGLLGGELEDGGTMVVAGGSLIATNCSLLVAAIFDPGGGLLIVSNGVVQARDVTVTSFDAGIGRVEVIGGIVTLSSSLTVGGSPESHGSLLVANGGLLVVTNNTTLVGSGMNSDEILTVSNASFLAADVSISGQESSAEFVIDNGTVTLSGQLDIGLGDRSQGEVFLNGGVLTVSNGATTVVGGITVSDGLFLPRDVFIGTIAFSGGILSVQGGISILSSNLQIGGGVFWRDCFDNRRPTVRYKCSNRSNQNLSRRNSGIHCFRRPIGGKDHRIERFFWR